MNIGIVVFEDISRCPRAKRLLSALRSRGYCVTDRDNLQRKTSGQVRIFVLKLYRFLLLLLGCNHYYVKSVCRPLDIDHCEVVFSFDILPVEYQSQFSDLSHWIIDLREYYPEQFIENRIWYYTFGRFYQRFFDSVAKIQATFTTVSHGIRKQYLINFSLDPLYFPSYPYIDDFPEIDFCTQLGPIRAVYHGVTNSNRNLLELINLISCHADIFVLDLYLVKTDSEYFKRIESESKKLPNIRLLDAVPFDLIVTTMTAYDIGMIAYNSRSENLNNCLPNKFFEYVMAGVVPVTTGNYDAALINDVDNIGFCFSDYDEFIQAITTINKAEINHRKQKLGEVRNSFDYRSLIDKYISLIEHKLDNSMRDGS